MHDQIKSKTTVTRHTQNHSYVSVATSQSFGVQHRDWLIGGEALTPPLANGKYEKMSFDFQQGQSSLAVMKHHCLRRQ